LIHSAQRCRVWVDSENAGENMLREVRMSRIIEPVRELIESLSERMPPVRIGGYGRTADHYNRAVGNVLRRAEVSIRFGRNSRTLASTDLTTVLRACRQKVSVQETIVSAPDRKFFSDLLIRLANKPEVRVSLDDVMRLRKIAYGNKEIEPPTQAPEHGR